MSPKYRAARKSSDAENAGLKPRAYKQLGRVSSSSVLRDSALLRRKRVLSGITASKALLEHVKQQQQQRKVSTSHDQVKPKAEQVTLRFTLPTPPASPMCVSPVPGVKAAARHTKEVRLPLHLPRPAPEPVSREALESCDPEIEPVPTDYLRAGLYMLGPKMHNVLAGIRAAPFSSDNGLPKELVVLAHDLSTEMPSHMLAVYGPAPLNAQGRPMPSTPSNRTNVVLYPTHKLVLSAWCSRLPRMPHSNTVHPTQPGGAVKLPVVPLSVHYPEHYAPIQSYLYTRDRTNFLSKILPMTPPPSMLQPGECTYSPEYVDQLARTFTPEALLDRLQAAGRIHQNMCDLGVQDESMWDLVQTSWEVLLQGLRIGEQRPKMVPQFV